MKIGELAEQVGMTVAAVRFYEQAGLLPKPPRTGSGYRVYGTSDLRRLELVRHAKNLGFSLQEIKRILRLREQGSCPCGEVISMLEGHLSRTDEQIERLRRFRGELAQTLAEWKRSPDDAVPGEVICGLIERTMRHHKGGRNGTSTR
jgi:DNA-binding transcriptional MerR regulator